MARTASKFANHTSFGPFGKTVEMVAGLTAVPEVVAASDIVKGEDGKTDETASRSGDAEIQVYSAESLEAALQLFGGSEAELIKSAVNSYNDANRDAAKRHITASIEGPEKRIEKLLTSFAKHFDVTIETLRARVKAEPAYLDMILSLGK